MSLPFLDNPPPVAEPEYWDYAPGKRLAWNDFGAPGGAPVFYYHGWPSSRLQARLAHHLAKDRGLRLIAMDRPALMKLVVGTQLHHCLSPGELGRVAARNLLSAGGP